MRSAVEIQFRPLDQRDLQVGKENMRLEWSVCFESALFDRHKHAGNGGEMTPGLGEQLVTGPSFRQMRVDEEDYEL